jgi:uncharacterized protein YdhG (YjbR/CyaY superfamily)
MADRREPDPGGDVSRVRIDAILAALPADQRVALQTLRETIAAAAPDAVDGFSYGMPAFRYRGHGLVAYGGAKGHCSLFPLGSGVVDAHREDLAGFSTSKGTIRFTPDHPLPQDLVVTIVQERLVAIDRRHG